MSSRSVLVTVSNKKTGDLYLARSYPASDYDRNGKMELYKAPVYQVYIDGTDDTGGKTRKSWTAVRFAPYYNDPNHAEPHYKHRGWANAGLHHLPKKIVGF